MVARKHEAPVKAGVIVLMSGLTEILSIVSWRLLTGPWQRMVIIGENGGRRPL